MLGVYWKIQDICYQMGTEIFNIEEEMTEKMKHKVTNPPLKKSTEFTAHNIHWLILSAILEGVMVLELDTSGQGCKTTFTLPSTKVWNKFCFHCKSWKCRGSSKECCEQWILTIFLGGVGNFMLHFLSHFFFNIENLSAHVVANILNFPKHPQHLHFGWVWG